MPDPITNITAILDKQPPGPTKAWVSADVTVPTIAATARLVKSQPQGINPKILLLEVVVDSGSEPSGSAVTVRTVRFDESPAAEDYESTTITHDGDSKSKDFEIVV